LRRLVAGAILMRESARRRARWFSHANAINPPARMRHWLMDKTSLTAKLVAYSQRFGVQPLRQGVALCLEDETAPVKLPRRVQIRERDVLLQCDGRAVVYAHTVIPLKATMDDWPFFRSLGTRSLGSALFSDPLIRRGHMQFSRLPAGHPLIKRAASVLGSHVVKGPLFARRCLYRRKRGHLLVTELFLPAVYALSAPAHAASKPTQQQ
jgi:chorismate--pyruvate lyase